MLSRRSFGVRAAGTSAALAGAARVEDQSVESPIAGSNAPKCCVLQRRRAKQAISTRTSPRAIRRHVHRVAKDMAGVLEAQVGCGSTRGTSAL